MNTLHDDLQVFSKHNHSGSAGEGNANVAGASAASPFVYRQEIVCHIAPSSTANVTINQSQAVFFGAHLTATGNTAPWSTCFPIGLINGIYNVDVMYFDQTTTGIASVIIGSSTIGELDEYGPGGVINSVCRYSASIPTTGSYVFTFTANGKKNDLSTGSKVVLTSFYIKRTGNY